MRNVRVPLMLIVGLAVLWVAGRPTELAAERGGERKIALIDDCDPADPAWLPVGCLQEKGDVTNAEFDMFLRSPLYNNAPAGSPPALFLVGHPSWRNEPSHLVVEEGEEDRRQERRRETSHVHQGGGVRRRARSAAARGYADRS